MPPRRVPHPFAAALARPRCNSAHAVQRSAHARARRAMLHACVIIAVFAGALSGCAVRDLPPTPKWRTEEGRKALWRDLANFYIESGLPEEALDMVSRLREVGERDDDLSLIQARALVATGMVVEGRKLLEQLVSRQSKSAALHRALGIAYADESRPADAIRALQAAVKLEPDHAPSRNNLGFLLLVEGRCKEAVAELEALFALDASEARYRNNLGYALVCDGEPDRALRIFRSTAHEPQARFQLGIAFERVGNHESAALQYERALMLDPEFTAAADALSRLGTQAVSPLEPE